ncbi:lysozyme [Rhizobium leguminosarum]|uniref:Lysozyme n=1 Tax=Rhizobium leguminosarum TaxID=384 RepID=A0AAE2MEY2_RHILE|nr:MULTISPECIES: lysozyme [Rhizobium]MBB4288096.1 lysozyme [Rhizobium leguminosarum]MBB4295813.1 lysozyme [Rhizobium leguminosarum]MBB4307205.1 lysozyme [Rhizobium leguminosarum]MBB4417212.1 lysozyme [Rhizobium leguminosarum]MBB4432056.1 lysozyme [Rhizobium esperanzae]
MLKLFSLSSSLSILFLASAHAESQVQLSHVPSQSQVEDFNEPRGASKGVEARPILVIASELIKYFEGWYPSAYDDPAAYCTIGYGHLIALQACASIDLGEFARPLSKGAGAALLEKDTRTARIAVQRYVKVDLSDEQFSALASFTFNVGKEKFADSTLLELVNDGDFDAAANQFGRWIKAKGKVLPGLKDRRACEAALFRGNLQSGKNSTFDRSDCAGLGVASGAGPVIDIFVGE